MQKLKGTFVVVLVDDHTFGARIAAGKRHRNHRYAAAGQMQCAHLCASLGLLVGNACRFGGGDQHLFQAFPIKNKLTNCQIRKGKWREIRNKSVLK